MESSRLRRIQTLLDRTPPPTDDELVSAVQGMAWSLGEMKRKKEFKAFVDAWADPLLRIGESGGS
jgi:hypothetical protein